MTTSTISLEKTDLYLKEQSSEQLKGKLKDYCKEWKRERRAGGERIEAIQDERRRGKEKEDTNDIKERKASLVLTSLRTKIGILLKALGERTLIEAKATRNIKESKLYW